MSNLIMGVSMGYNKEQLMPFVNSLRKYYNEKVVFFMYQKDYDILQDFLVEYDITAKILTKEELDFDHVEICNYRHKFYHDYLLKNDANRVLITDVRDVIFQGNVFDYPYKSELVFFLESEKIKNCDCNGQWWIGNVYGNEILDMIGENYICCAGTTIGTREGMLFYTNSLLKELERVIKTRHPSLQKTNPIVDQAALGYLLYTGRFHSNEKYMTGCGPIATMSFHKNYTFNSEDFMLNYDGSIPSAVHQWDRTDKKDIFLKKALQKQK